MIPATLDPSPAEKPPANPPAVKGSRFKERVKDLSVWVIAAVFFLPELWIFLSAFKTPQQILAVPPRWIFRPTLQGLTAMAHEGAFWTYVFNSFFITFTAVFVAVGISFLAAYGLSRYRFRGGDFLMFVLLSIRMVPGSASVLPLFLMYTALGWTNTYAGIIAFDVMFSIPFAIWILKGYLDGVSPRFDESAQVDGFSRWRTMFRIILPQILPGIVAAFIFNMIFVWNESLFNAILGGNTVQTIPVALQSGLNTINGINWQYIASLSFVYTVPLMATIYFFQKYLLVGMTFGTVRGEI
ncbi:MAG: carbohydrate ABC transporter permease [Thermaerobacter sp.]|nr:carbohydrate ABC transporter permease [Thermaerobacter sp.]